MKRNGKGSFKGRKIAADSDDDNDDFSISDDDSEINSDSNNSDSDTGDESDHEGNFSVSHALVTTRHLTQHSCLDSGRTVNILRPLYP